MIEKLVPQPQEAVALGFLILNDAVIRSFDVVNLRARQVAEREGVDQHIGTSALDQNIFGLRVGHEIEAVLEARAATTLDAV